MKHGRRGEPVPDQEIIDRLAELAVSIKTLAIEAEAAILNLQTQRDASAALEQDNAGPHD